MTISKYPVCLRHKPLPASPFPIPISDGPCREEGGAGNGAGSRTSRCRRQFRRKDPLKTHVAKISNSPLHFITSQSDFFLPPHKLSPCTEPMYTTNCVMSMVMTKTKTCLHSITFGSAPAPAAVLLSLVANPQR